MSKKKLVVIIISFLVIALLLLCPYYLYHYFISNINILTFVDKPSEQIFREFVLTDKTAEFPVEVTQVQGLEGARLDPLKGPVYVYFQTDSDFVDVILTKDYVSWNPYSEVSCQHFFEAVDRAYFIRNYPESFVWWRPLEISTPKCYRSGNKDPFYDDEAKYLLVNKDRTEVYFFRTTTPLIAAD